MQSNSVIVYRSQQEKMMDEFVCENPFVGYIAFGLFLLFILFIVVGVVKTMFFKKKF